MSPQPPVDRGNRAFWGLVGLDIGFRGLLLILSGCATCVIVARLAAIGPAALWIADGWATPAVLLSAMLVATTIGAGVRLVVEIRSARALRRELHIRTAAPDVGVLELAGRFALDGRVTLVDSDEPFAFTHGLLTPRVVVSSALTDILDVEELAAVFAHEAAHVRNRDPLKVLVARMLVARERYLPALRHLSLRFVAGRELAADRQAIAHCGTRPLAGALLRTLAPPDWAVVTPAATMASAASVDTRIVQLERGEEPPSPPVPRRPLYVSVTAAVLMLAAAADAVVLVQRLCMRGM